METGGQWYQTLQAQNTAFPTVTWPKSPMGEFTPHALPQWNFLLSLPTSVVLCGQSCTEPNWGWENQAQALPSRRVNSRRACKTQDPGGGGSGRPHRDVLWALEGGWEFTGESAERELLHMCPKCPEARK